MRFNILPSPTPSIVLHHYEKDLFPVFNHLFAVPSPSPPLQHFARDPQEALVAVILENQSDKPVTAWRFRWQFTDALGRQRSGTMSGDSYAVDVFRPIADPASRHLITPLLSVSLFPFSQAASVAILPSALFCERYSLGARWVFSFQ
jgi:hypothetical protein